MASKRKLENLEKYNDNNDNEAPFDPMSEPLFTEPQDNYLDNCCDLDVNNLPDSQPLYDSDSTQQDVNNLPDSQPLYDSDSTQSYTCRDKKSEPEKEKPEYDLKIKLQDTESNIEKKVQNMEPNATSCVHCMFDKELDKRNYYFGNLLIGELQFLPPCMRSEAYITILRYINSLKNKHRDDHK